MKIGASDYDGTLFRGQTIAAEDVAGVRAWRAAGHKFGVVSGRDYGMLSPQLKFYGIASDYAVCNNGSIILNAAGAPLWQGSIPLAVLAEIAEEPCLTNSFHFAFSAADKTYLCHEGEGSWIMREAKEWDFPIVKIAVTDIGSLPQIQQFCLGYHEAKEAAATSDILNAKYGATVHAYPNGCSVDITPANVSKSQGIKKLLDLMRWEDAEVFAIGDETNDLPMLDAFGGFTVATARDAIKAKARAVYQSVGDMLINNI